MNKKSLLIPFVVVALVSCESRSIGSWDDNIKLSTKVVNLNSGKDSVTIKTGGDIWWLTSITLDAKVHNDFGNVNVLSSQYSVKVDYFKFSRADKNTIVVKADANTTAVSRSIVVNLEAGDYFDSIKITQNPK